MAPQPTTCLSYHKHYNNSIDHDNIYISEYFKRIDQDRKAHGKNSILPLKKEKRNLIDVDNVWQRTIEESRAVTFYLLQFALETVTALFFLFLDYIIVSVLMVIRKNSEMSFVQEGEHTIHFSIQGSSLIARLLRSTMRNFNMHETVSTYMTNEPSLPRPTFLPRRWLSRQEAVDRIVEPLKYYFTLNAFETACLSYHKHYNNSIDHDNIYISEYFKRIDQDRKAHGKNSILPLKKEKRNLIDVDNVWQRTIEESRAVTFYLLQFALETVTALFFLFLDYIIVSVLMVIRKNSEMSFVQEGEHTIHFSIQGSSLIARLLRSTMRNFNMHETVSTYMTNEPSLPRPTFLPRRLIIM